VRLADVGEDRPVEGRGSSELVGVRIAASDLDATARSYAALLGLPPGRARGCVRFELRTGVVEIEPGGAGGRAVAIAGESDAGADFGGLRVVATAPGSRPPADDPSAAVAIDHVVIATRDPERAIAVWRDRMGFRLALDRAFSDRGLRMMFFRSGGMTLEVTAPLDAGAVAGAESSTDSMRDSIFGVAYRVFDLEGCRRRLVDAGFDVSEIRRGRKPETEVVTVRSGTGDLPTLLIRDPSRDAADGRETSAR
jgi:catechol 2,3-dioxygenase-like lactoylglutathione lyase family enzyme